MVGNLKIIKGDFLILLYKIADNKILSKIQLDEHVYIRITNAHNDLLDISELIELINELYKICEYYLSNN